MNILFYIILILLPIKNPLAWSGFDYETGEYIDIGSGNLVRSGSNIEIYDYNDGLYHDVEVLSVNSNTVEVYDNETGDYRVFDMNANTKHAEKKYQRELVSEALYMEAYKEANSLSAAFEQGKISRSDFEIGTRAIQDKYANAGIGSAKDLNAAITAATGSSNISLKYDLYKTQQEDAIKRAQKVETDAIDNFKKQFEGATKGKTDSEVKAMMQQQKTFADIAERANLWYQQAAADGNVTDDEKNLLAKSFADAGSYNIALSMGEEIAEFFKHSPEINEQNLFAFKNTITQSLVQKGVDRNMAMMAADSISDRFGLSETVRKVNEQKISVKQAAEYERDVAKAIAEGQEEKFKAFVGPGYNMFMKLPDVQKLQFQELYPEAYKTILSAVNGSILDGQIQDNTKDIGATHLSVKALEFGLAGQTGNKEIDAGQVTSAITGAVNENTIPTKGEPFHPKNKNGNYQIE